MRQHRLFSKGEFLIYIRLQTLSNPYNFTQPHISFNFSLAMVDSHGRGRGEQEGGQVGPEEE